MELKFILINLPNNTNDTLFDPPLIPFDLISVKTIQTKQFLKWPSILTTIRIEVLGILVLVAFQITLQNAGHFLC